MNTDHSTLHEVFIKQQRKSIELRKQLISDRKKELRRLADFILQKRDIIKEAVHKDFKKPYAEIDVTEIYPVVSEIRHTVRHLDRWADATKVDAPLTYLGTRSEILYEPKGVCLIISPWNFPFNLCFGPLVSCIAAGNTAIIKPSELTPNTSSMIADLIKEFFPEERVAVAEGDQEVSSYLLGLPFDHIFFTGSPAVGKIVMKAAAENLTSVTLELGGKSPVIVDETGSISKAAQRIAFSKFFNNGQTCIAPDYAFVHESIYTSFVASLKESALKLFGSGNSVTESSADYARIVNEKHFHRVTNLVEEAIQKGAKQEWSGSTNAPTNFIHPVILSHVSLDSRIMEEEIFGPVLPVLSYQSIDEVVELINKKPKPLALYLFSNNKSTEEKILTETSSGSVCINDCVIQFTHPNLPFGGVNNSGIGKAHGQAGFLAFSNEKSALKQSKIFSMAGLLHPPYTSNLKKLIDLMIRWF